MKLTRLNRQGALVPALVVGGILLGGAIYMAVLRTMQSRTPRRRRIHARVPVMVRVTENGKRYHRDNCPLLRGAYREIPIVEAIENYEPCKACHPPGGE